MSRDLERGSASKGQNDALTPQWLLGQHAARMTPARRPLTRRRKRYYPLFSCFFAKMTCSIEHPRGGVRTVGGQCRQRSRIVPQI